MIADRVAAVRERIARAAERASRRPETVTLLAVSKTFLASDVRAAFDAGLRVFGENRVQEAEPKIAELASLAPAGLRWHLVGHLQSNKARRAAALFDVVHSVDSLEIGQKLARCASEAGRVLRVLVQVDLAGETTKFGMPEQQLAPTLEALRGSRGLQLAGLMLMPPFFEDPEEARPYFRKLRALAEWAQRQGLLDEAQASMGMSHDFEVAVEEGATIVRVGSAIFGERASAA